MAVERKIITRIAVEGDKAYKTAISDLKREQKTLTSEMKLTEAQFKGNANSMDALTAKGKTLDAEYEKQIKLVNTLKDALANAQSSQTAHGQRTTELKEKLAAAEKEMTRLKNSTEDTSEAQAAQQKVIDGLKNEIAQSEKNYNTAGRTVENYKKQLNDAERGVVELDDELQKNNKYLNEAKSSADGTAKSIDAYGKETKEAAAETEKLGDSAKSTGQQLGEALASMGIIAAVKKLAQAMGETVNASMEFESAITGVFKTVEGTEQQLAKITAGITEMSKRIPASTTEIAAVAEAAGQLGVKTDDVLSFTEVMINLGVATNVTAEEAATMIARFANVTKLDASKYENLGSAIVELGNNFATTEGEIMQMAQSIASAGTIAGISQPEILGLAAALSSVGIQAEVGGTSISTLISTMQVAVETGSNGLEDFAFVAGMTAEQFQAAWGQNATNAIISFVKGLNDTERTGKSAIATLQDMDITQTRMRNTILSMASASDVLESAIRSSNAAFEDNTALQSEADKRYATLESKTQMYKNSVNALKVAVGDSLTPAMSNLTSVMTGITDGLTKFAEENPEVVRALAAIATGVGVVAAGIAAYTLVVNLAEKAQAAFNITSATTPWGAIALAVAGVAAVVGLLSASYEDNAMSVKNLTTATREAKETVEGLKVTYEEEVKAGEAAALSAEIYADRLEQLETQGLNNAAAQEEYKLTVDMLNKAMPELNATIDAQTGLISGGTAALRTNITKWKDYYIQQAQMKLVQGQMEELAAVQVEYFNNAQKLGIVEDDLSYLQEERAKAIEALSEATGLSTQAIQDQIDAYGTLTEDQSTWDESATGLIETISGYNSAIGTLTTEQGNLSEAIELNEGSMNSLDGEINTLTETFTLLNTATGEAAAGIEYSTTGIGESVDRTTEAYTDMYDEAYSSINSQMKLFGDYSNKASHTTKDVTKSFKEQADYMNTYAANIREAARLGIDRGLLATLSDGSVESAQILAGIVKDGGKCIDDLNAEFARTETGKAAFAQTVADMGLGFKETSKEIVGDSEQMAKDLNQSGTAKKSGEQTGDGYVKGLLAKKQAMYNAGVTLAKAGNEGFRKENQIKSPSRVAMKDGGYWGEGLVIGTKSKIKDYEKVNRDMAIAGAKAFEKEGKVLTVDFAANVPSAQRLQETAISATATQMPTQQNNNNGAGHEDVVSAFIEALEKVGISIDGKKLVGAIAEEVDKQLGEIKKREERRTA